MARWSRMLARLLLEWIEVPPGAVWLDLCCGTGILSMTIAECREPSRVVGVDRSDGQIDFARRHRAGLNIEYQVADAMSLPLPDASFDACVSGLGLNFITDPAKALEEVRRVMRPGGLVAAYVWEYSARARFLREFWDAAIAVDPSASEFDQGRRFAICSAEGLRAAFEAAGFGSVETRPLDISMHFESFDDYWRPFLLGQGSGPTYLAARDESVRDAIRERLRAVLPVAADGSIRLEARAQAVRGTRP